MLLLLTVPAVTFPTTLPVSVPYKFEATTAAAREIAESTTALAQSAYREGKTELSAVARDVKHAACTTYSSLTDQTSAITNEWCEKASAVEAELSLPKNTTGTFIWVGKQIQLHSGIQKIKIG